MALQRAGSYQTLYEPEDYFGSDINFLQEVVAPTSAPAPVTAPAPAPFNPVGFDWSQGVQNIGGTIYQPQFESTGSGEDFQQGPVNQLLRYQEGQTAPGKKYDILDPATGKVTGQGVFKENSHGFFGDFFRGLRDVAEDTAPLWTAAIGLGPLGGMLGGAAASALGVTGLSAAQTAALGSAIAGGAGTALQGGDLGDVLKGAATTALPSFLLPNIPSTGTPIIDKAIQAGTQVAIRGGDVEQAVIGSLLNSGIATAVGETGLDPKLVNAVVQAAQSEGDPQKLFNAITGAASKYLPTQAEGFMLPEAADPTAFWYPGTETQAFFPEFEQALLTEEPVDWAALYAQPTTNPVTGETIVGADQSGYPAQNFGAAPQSDINEVYDRIINDMGGFTSTWQTVGSDRVMVQDDGSAIGINTETNESYGLTPEDTQRMIDAGLLNTAASGYNTAISGTPPAPSPAPSPAPTSAPSPAPGPSPAPAPAAQSPDLSSLLSLLGRGQGTQTTYNPILFQGQAIDLDKLFGYREPSSTNDLLAMIGQKPRG